MAKKNHVIVQNAKDQEEIWGGEYELKPGEMVLTAEEVEAKHGEILTKQSRAMTKGEKTAARWSRIAELEKIIAGHKNKKFQSAIFLS